jgi:hypothetical protein
MEFPKPFKGSIYPLIIEQNLIGLSNLPNRLGKSVWQIGLVME